MPARQDRGGVGGETAIVAPSRAMSGVINFDIGRDITDPDSLSATEVYDDRAAMDCQEAQPEVAKLLDRPRCGHGAGEDTAVDA